MSDCQFEKPPFHQCCCVCRNHIVTLPKASTEGQPGWACAAPMTMTGDPFQRTVFVNWPEHSAGCELWDDIRLGAEGHRA